MNKKDAEIIKHAGCPNRHHCLKDESKCCYLVKGRCIANEYTDNYILKKGRLI